jgi:Domain of unknown function (DUF4281)
MTTLLSITPDQMYLFLNFGVMPFWALIIFLPMLKITDTLVHSVLAPIVLGVTYAWLLANVMGGVIQMPEGAGFASLDALVKTFSVKEALVAGWAHYIVFDLFVGAWIARDAQRVGLNQFVVAIPLLLTFVVGPIGLVSYLMLRGLTGRGGWSLFEG